ncbi:MULTISPECIES: chaplin [Streptomyces]|uniref:chaplin n=1 Tax=Streptomyces TaxID=1883 RepID=UPI002109739B|nr:chaplin [Streptomyces longispororuber]MCQ4213153.1 chaplin [Streptomyces longispororuber]
MKTAKKAALVLAAAGFAAGAASGAAFADGGASAEGAAVESPGVASGNLGQLPVHVPVNVSGNTVNGIAGLNPSFGNTAVND